jgi:hypothetical protein
VRLSIRRGVLRFSLHLYNNSEDVARVLDLTRKFLAADGIKTTAATSGIKTTAATSGIKTTAATSKRG